MKVNLLIPIEVSEDGKHCEECAHRVKKNSDCYADWCWVFRKSFPHGGFEFRRQRLPACLAAERKAKEGERMNYTPKELELCRWLHDHGVRPEIREGDWYLDRRHSMAPFGPFLCTGKMIPDLRDIFILLLTWERAREWLRERGWRLVSGFEELSGQIELRFEYTRSMKFCDGSDQTDLEAILSVMVQIVEGEKR